ncbi:MAG: ferritin-like domain-containing protein [Cyanobacteria bacterium P01_H01_bin.58]
MNPFAPILHLIGSSATAYLLSSQIRDVKTRPNVLAGFYLAESGSVPYLTALRDRAAAEGDMWLAERLTKHANDERRHGQIFANALKQIGKEAITPTASSQATKSSSQREKSPFFDAYYRDYSATDLKPEAIEWGVFLGSTYILEADAYKDFHHMATALTDVPDMAKVRAGILSVAKDEAGHAAYLKEAIQRRYDYFTAEALINEWRSRKSEALMAMVMNTIERRGKLRTLAQDRVDEAPDSVESEVAFVAAA